MKSINTKSSHTIEKTSIKDILLLQSRILLLIIVTFSLLIINLNIQKTSKVDAFSQDNSTTATTTTTTTTTTSLNLPIGPEQQQRQQRQNVTDDEPQFKLDCQPGEQRQFSYESSTKVWGSTDQQVRLRAILRLKCMETPTNTTLKYLAEIVNLTPSFIYQNEPVDGKLRTAPATQDSIKKRLQVSRAKDNLERSSFSGLENYNRRYLKQQQHSEFSRQREALRSQIDEAEVDQVLRAEPLLEEVGEVALRMKRSVSGWFSKAWVSVRDFFGNIFTSTERSSVSREQAFKESGLDIAGQCKAPSSSSSHKDKGVGLPFDESVFEDLGPEYYIGASSLDSGTTAYEFSSTGHASASEPSVSDDSDLHGTKSGNGDDDDDDESANEMTTLSFFDDPPVQRRQSTLVRPRSKRASNVENNNNNNNKKSKSLVVDSGEHERLLKIPFVFVQLRTGKILEIRFSGDESDLSVKNFKRHLCDLFATNLDWNKTTQNEVSPIGKHQTKYTLDSSTNSIDSIKKTALKATSEEEEERSSSLANRQQLVRVLAMMGTNDRRLIKDGELAVAGNQTRQPTSTTSIQDNGDDNADRNVNQVGLGEESNASREEDANLQASRSVSILRTINTTSSVQLSSKMLTPDIDRMQVRIKQVQQINDGRLVGTAGQLSMSLMQVQTQTQTQTRRAQELNPSPFLRTKRHTGANYESSLAPNNQEQVEDISDLLKVSTSFSMQLVPIPRNPDGSIDDNNDNNNADDNERGGKSPAPRSDRSRRFASTSLKEDEQVEKDFKSKLNKKETTTERSTPTGKRPRKRESSSMIRKPPSDFKELQRVLQEWRKQEARLQLSSTNLVAENNGQIESQLNRLDILRDQIRQRLNEEFVRNRIRRSLAGSSGQKQGTAAAAAAVARASLARTSDNNDNDETHKASSSTGQKQKQVRQQPPPPPSPSGGGDMGLGLTQLVLENGITTKRKGSIYWTIEEVLELENELADEQADQAISKLIRDTIKMDKLRSHCKSSIPTMDTLSLDPSTGGKFNFNLERELRLPFGVGEEKEEEDAQRVESFRGDKSNTDERQHHKQARPTTQRARQVVNQFAKGNERKLNQCQQMLRIMLKLNERQAIDLVLDLIDDCNQRLLAAAKQEELGYGPISKYYRRLRQTFIELLTHLTRPSDSLLDKLLSRLYYPKLLPQTGQTNSKQGKPSSPARTATTTTTTVEPEFVYVNRDKHIGKEQTKFNKSLLKDEDDFNNNDGAALMVMTLTSLAAKSSVSRTKRLEVAEKLLATLKGTACSLFNAPDLDIIESMANFQEPLDEIVGRILQLARRCKQHDQYTVACVHGLSGQLAHVATQRFLNEQLRSFNCSCTIKSEIVLTLIGAQLIEDLKQAAPTNKTIKDNGQTPAAATTTTTTTTHGQWPSYGQNKIDETLMQIIESDYKQGVADRRCLGQLIVHYFSRKRQTKLADTASSGKNQSRSSRSNNSNGSRIYRQQQQQQQDQQRRFKRWAVVNEHNFWDDAQCKRWNLPADGGPLTSDSPLLSGLNNSHFYSNAAAAGNNSLNYDLIDEIDDGSILTALMINNNGQKQARSFRRNQKLIERELDSSVNGSSSSSSSMVGNTQSTADAGAAAFLRRRHKCVASKDFGPKNAQASLRAEIVNDLIGAKDENKFLARFRLTTNFLGNRIDVGRMYLWHQRRTTRAYANILGRSIWDSSHGCADKPPSQVLYMPLFDFNLWLVKVSVGLRLNAEMGFYPNCNGRPTIGVTQAHAPAPTPASNNNNNSKIVRQQVSSQLNELASLNDELQLYPTVTLRAAGEATAKLIVARAGMSIASQYSYQGDIRVSRQPESCMSIYSAHQPMNITFSSWFQLWDNECHFWGSRGRAEPQAIKWRLNARKPSVWLQDECLNGPAAAAASSRETSNNGSLTTSVTNFNPTTSNNVVAAKLILSQQKQQVSAQTISP